MLCVDISFFSISSPEKLHFPWLIVGTEIVPSLCCTEPSPTPSQWVGGHLSSVDGEILTRITICLPSYLLLPLKLPSSIQIDYGLFLLCDLCYQVRIWIYETEAQLKWNAFFMHLASGWKFYWKAFNICNFEQVLSIIHYWSSQHGCHNCAQQSSFYI